MRLLTLRDISGLATRPQGAHPPPALRQRKGTGPTTAARCALGAVRPDPSVPPPGPRCAPRPLRATAGTLRGARRNPSEAKGACAGGGRPGVKFTGEGGARACLTVSACPTVGSLRLVPSRPVRRRAMAGGLESVESCLEQHIPPEDLAEVKRILYGGEARCAARTGWPPPAVCLPPPSPSGSAGMPSPGVEGEGAGLRPGEQDTGLG